MSNPNGLDRLALALLSAGVAVTVLGACGVPTTVIGRSTGQASNARVGTTGAKKPAKPAETPRPQILVKFKDTFKVSELTTFRAAFGLRHVSMIASLGVFVEEVTIDRPVDEILRELNASPQVEYAELNGEVNIGPM